MNKLTLICRLNILEISRHNLEVLYNDTQEWYERKRINKLLYVINKKISIINNLIK
jgi:hypothetical protein